MTENQKLALQLLEPHKKKVIAYRNLCDEISHLRYMASGAGAIRYDKDRVQTSPEDLMLKCMVDVADKEAQRKHDLEIINQEANDIFQYIKHIKSIASRNILCVLYLECIYDVSSLSKQMNIPYNTLHKAKQRALDRLGNILYLVYNE